MKLFPAFLRCLSARSLPTLASQPALSQTPTSTNIAQLSAAGGRLLRGHDTLARSTINGLLPYIPIECVHGVAERPRHLPAHLSTSHAAPQLVGLLRCQLRWVPISRF